MRRLITRSHESYLVPKSRLNVKPITLRLPVALLDELSALKARAEKAGFMFDVQAAVTEALERTAAQVTASLDGMENGNTFPEKPVVEGRTASRGVRRKVPLPEDGVQP